MKLIPRLIQLPALMLAFAGLSLLPAQASEPAPTRAETKYEVKFLNEMIHHHMMGVEMAELCLDRAITPELEVLCHAIIETQSAEIELMEGWLLDWYGLQHEAKPKPGQEKAMDRLAELTGEEFEIAFLRMMIRHHAGAVREGTRCVDRAHHEELVELCHSIVESQSEEIELMESWLRAWYGRRH